MANSRDYHHPYEPYAIQQQFMDAVYECLEEGKVGIFESPTGTGKSLSLICGSLTWLRDQRRRRVDGNVAAEFQDGEPVWMLEHARSQKRKAAVQRNAELNSRLTKIRAKKARARRRFESGEPPAKRQKQAIYVDSPEDEAAFVLEDYESDDEKTTLQQRPGATSLSTETQALIDQLGGPLPDRHKNDLEECEAEDETKVFFCSRTHSQLSQFASELRRVRIPPAIESEPPSGAAEVNSDIDLMAEEVKNISLGSRKNLCINRKVHKLESATGINERCMELQQPSTPADKKCQFLPNKENEALVNDFRDHALASVRDIEDLHKLGTKLRICPYYGSRSAVKPSEIVTLPYPLLLQKAAREALGISLKDHVVIVDEAHNLMDAIANIHSVTVSLAQLEQARAQLGVYLQKFRNRLKGKNRMYITQLVRLIDSLTAYLRTKDSESTTQDGLASISEIMAGKAVDQINLYKLMHYLQASRLARKVDGYSDLAAAQATPHTTSKGTPQTARRSTLPVLTHIQAFLLALTYPAAEGRFFYAKSSPQTGGSSTPILRYVLLDPTHHFREIVDEAKAVILAGGTMSPMSDYVDQLFHYLPSEQIQTLSCGHVIPPSNLVAMPIARGPGGIEFDFTFEKRNLDSMINELGRAICAIAGRIPDGLVVFFPSYAYLTKVTQYWQKRPMNSGSNQSLWEQMSALKPIFQESTSVRTSDSQDKPKPDTTTASTSIDESHKPFKADELLTAYASKIHDPNNSCGALLLAVIGGSLSEGINFADRLGRGIVVVGLPFPNARSPELKAKLEYIEQRSPLPPAERAAASREFYTNICMRAVNQSIGRAIRHKDDYAAIMLLDRRYAAPGIRGKLPAWIRGGLVEFNGGFQGTIDSLQRFFAGIEEAKDVRYPK